MTLLQRVLDPIHRLISLFNKDDEDRAEFGAPEGFINIGPVDEDNCIDVFALEGDMWTFVLDLNAEANQAREEKRVA